MGLLSRAVKVVWKFLVVFGIIVLVPGLPPDCNYTSYNVTPPRVLEGKLELNKHLDNAEILFHGSIKGPEAFTVMNGELYTTVHGGYVVKIVNNEMIPVVKFGQDCEGVWEESKCGRPLGIRSTDDGTLYVADAYYGIFKYNIHTKQKTVLVSKDTVIEGRKPRLFNSIELAEDGTIYWSDSTSDVGIEDGFYTMMADGTGRLFQLDPRTKHNKVLVDGLKFGNGVALSPDEDFVIVAETFGSRIYRYYLKGPKQGTTDIFFDGLPGLPDNMRRDSNGNFFVSMVLPADPQHPALSSVIAPFPLIRKFLARVVALIELPFKQLDIYYPNVYARRIAHYLAHFEMLKIAMPLGTTVLELNTNGDVVQSYHSRDGKIGQISDSIIHNGYIYLGSPTNPYLARVKIGKDFPYKSKPVVRETPTTTTTPKPTTTTTPKPTTTTTPKPTTTTTPKPTTTTPKPATTQKPTTAAPKTKQ